MRLHRAQHLKAAPGGRRLEVLLGIGEEDGITAAAGWLTAHGIGWFLGNACAAATAPASATSAGAANAERLMG